MSDTHAEVAVRVLPAQFTELRRALTGTGRGLRLEGLAVVVQGPVFQGPGGSVYVIADTIETEGPAQR